MNLDHPGLINYKPLIPVPALESQLQFRFMLDQLGTDQLRELLKQVYAANVKAAELINQIGRENAVLKLNYIDSLHDSKQHPVAARE